LPHGFTVVTDVVCQFQEKSKCSLRDGSGSVGWNICNNNLSFAGRRHVDNVVAGRRYADVPQRWQAANMVARNGNLVRQHDLSVARTLDYFAFVTPIVKRTWSKCFQVVPGKIARIQGIAVENDDHAGGKG
jgi:hypothetical protein